MQSWRIIVDSAAVDGVPIESRYADLFVVQRDGDALPGPTDWEVTVVSADRVHLEPGVHDLRLDTLDEHRVEGRAMLRFSDGSRHLFRGDADPIGLVAALG